MGAVVRMLRAAVALLVTGLMMAAGASGASAMPSSPVPGVVPSAVSDGTLSDSGEAAMDDLRVCLASQSTLNVYYLVDSSLSLSKADGGASGSGSDPDVVRASILGNSLAQLRTLGDVTVNWAAGFFSSDYSAAVGWQTLDDSGAEQLAQTIRQKKPGGYTNWPAALRGAQQQLAAQQSAAPGCQMLVWLTDGQLDIKAPDGQQQEDFDALNALCGAELDDRGAAAANYGIFNSFRQAGVVVIGALLAVDEVAQGASADMQAIVEGGTQCGVQPMPDSFVHGAFVEASDASTLALVFLQLSAQVSGGYPQPFEADGGFWIDEGVSRFRIVLAGDWTLTAPDGSQLSQDQPGDAQVTESDGATTIQITVDDDLDGHWKLSAGDARSLFLFSDLRIVFDDVSSIERSADGTLEATLKASVLDADGDPADLEDFGTARFSASYLDAQGSRVDLSEPVLDDDGRLTIVLPSDLALASIDVTAALDPLVTAEHALQLAPVRTETTVAVTLPEAYPHVDLDPPTTLSDLEGADGEATGTITIQGPAEGEAGTACFPAGDPVIMSDAGDRADTWEWSFGGLDAQGCISVPAGGQAQVSVTVRNPVAADSQVQAAVQIAFAAAGEAPITQDVPVQFRSTHPINGAAVLGITLLLLALGLLIPLIVLWILNAVTTKIDVPKSTQRAAFPISIGPATTITAPTQASALSDAFAYLSPSNGKRTITDPALGALRARVPWWPLTAPWYEIAAPVGTALVAARAGRTATGARAANGIMRFAKLPLDRFWAVLVPEAELRRTDRGETVQGTAVLYHRASPSEQAQHAQRLAEITVDGSLAEAVNRARAELLERERASRPAASSGGAPAGSVQSAPARTSSSTAPPPRASGGSAPPPRSAPDSRPPGRGPGTPPPPRPSAPPPPRRP